MFEFDSSRTLRAEENEKKPNEDSAAALRVGLITLLICLLLNETGMFHLRKDLLRICTAIGAVCALIPQVIAFNEKLAADPRSKYVVLGCVCTLCFAANLYLFPFAAPLALAPMLLAIQYRSVRVSKLSILGSGVCVVAAPPLGCMLGLWDSEFLRFLISCAKGREMAVASVMAPGGGLMSTGALGVFAFISVPWLMAVIMLSKLVLSTTRKGEDNIQARIQLLHMSRLDALTGLYNQNVYDQYLKSPVRDESVGILFFDVDGLKRTNDQKGHEWGDLLLRRCAESLQAIFDDNCHGFRIGGDEFLVVVDTEDEKVLGEKLEQWQQSMERINLENRTRHPGLFCHMSVGTAFGAKYDLSSLIVKADKRMYREKEAYHQSIGLVTAR